MNRKSLRRTRLQSARDSRPFRLAILSASLWLAFITAADADGSIILGEYLFTGGSASVSNVVAGVTFGDFARGGGITAETSTVALVSSNYKPSGLAASISANAYATFSVTPVAGYRVTLQTFQYDWQSEGGGGNDELLSSRGAGFVSTASLGTLASGTNKTLSLSSGTFSNLAGATTFRIYGHGASNASKKHTLDNVRLLGETQARASLIASVAGATTGRFYRGDPASLTLTVTNDSLAAGSLATEALAYSGGLSGASGISIGTISGNLGGGNSTTPAITVDTSTIGAKTALLTVTSANAWRANGTAGAASVDIPLAAAVVTDRTFNSPGLDLGGLLKGAFVGPRNVTVTSTGAHSSYANATVAAASNSVGGLIASGSAATFDGTTTSAFWTIQGTVNSYGPLGPLTLTTTGEAGLWTQHPNDVSIDVTGNVGLATATASGVDDLDPFVPADALCAAVAGAGAYEGLSSKTVAGGNVVGTEAAILDGDNTNAASQTVAMAWRDRADVEKPGTLISDVVRISGMAKDGGQMNLSIHETPLYVVRMSYDENLLPGGASNEAYLASKGLIALLWLNEAWNGVAGAQSTDSWKPASFGNFGGTTSHKSGAYDPLTDFVLGNYGEDAASHTVWAVVNHDGQFAAAVIPEPITLGMLALGGLLVTLRRSR